MFLFYSRIAAKSLRSQKMKHSEKPVVYLSANDVHLFTTGLRNDVLKCMRDIQTYSSNDMKGFHQLLWRLQKLCIVYLIAFNRKRPGKH